LEYFFPFLAEENKAEKGHSDLCRSQNCRVDISRVLLQRHDYRFSNLAGPAPPLKENRREF
jgi:hypothetical protein